MSDGPMVHSYHLGSSLVRSALLLTTPTHYNRWVAAEGEVYDVNYAVKLRDMQINELEMEVSDMRGKFIIPKLKKVHNFKLMGGEE